MMQDVCLDAWTVQDRAVLFMQSCAGASSKMKYNFTTCTSARLYEWHCAVSCHRGIGVYVANAEFVGGVVTA